MLGGGCGVEIWRHDEVTKRFHGMGFEDRKVVLVRHLRYAEETVNKMDYVGIAAFQIQKLMWTI
jgi:hypothetical protein